MTAPTRDMLKPDEAQAFLDAMKREAHAQPEKPQTYRIARGVELIVEYRPGRKFGRLLRDDELTAPDAAYYWSLRVAAWVRSDPAFVPAKQRGIRGISEDDALRLCMGETPDELKVRYSREADDVFQRVAANHALRPWGGLV